MSIEIDVQCENCGEDLTVVLTIPLTSQADLKMRVTPCETCLERKHDEGFDAGRMSEG